MLSWEFRRVADAKSTTLVHGPWERGLPTESQERAPRQARPIHSQSSRPSPVRPSGRRHYLDKTSRSSSADSSRSRVLLPPAAPEPPPDRSFSFSPLKDAAMLPTGPQPETAQLSAGEERRAPEAEASVTEAEARVTEARGNEAKATAAPMGLETHCGRRRPLMGQRGILRSNPGRRAENREARRSALALRAMVFK